MAIVTPQAGDHNDLYNIQTWLEEVCTLLEEAGIDFKSVFMNANAGFDAEDVRQVCAKKEIEVNIDQNKRNEKVPTEEYVYFDERGGSTRMHRVCLAGSYMFMQ